MSNSVIALNGAINWIEIELNIVFSKHKQSLCTFSLVTAWCPGTKLSPIFDYGKYLDQWKSSVSINTNPARKPQYLRIANRLLHSPRLRHQGSWNHISSGGIMEKSTLIKERSFPRIRGTFIRQKLPSSPDI